MTTASPIDMIRQYSDAGYPAIAIETYEEARIIKAVSEMFPDRPLSTVDARQKITDLRTRKQTDGPFPAAFTATSQRDEAILIALDFRHVVNSPAGYRPLLAALPGAKAHHALIILIGPSWSLPEELKHEIPVLQIPLPSQAEHSGPLSVIEESVNASRTEAKKPPLDLTEERRHALTAAARGLTLAEAENAFALAASSNGFTPALVEREKMRLVRSECLTVEAPADPASLAGLDRLKEYIRAEMKLDPTDPDLMSRGILLVGVPGTGKSLTARIIAAMLGIPLIRLDVGAAKGSLVGQSEGNMRAALRTADAVAPAVLWLDEVEKGVGGYASSSQTDGGTTLAMVGTLLTWMQEHTTPVIVVATCNDFSKLPPELTRAGRFDERFFLDLPTTPEREAIAAVHIARLKCAISAADQATIPALTADWTGAEIEQLIKSSARRTARKLDAATLKAAAAEIIPISRTANVQELRKWAGEHLRRANGDEPATAPQPARKITTSDPAEFISIGGHGNA